CVPKPYGSQFEKLRPLRWRREHWPRGGVYVYKADLDEVDARTVVSKISDSVVLTPETLSALVNDQDRVNTEVQDSVPQFLTRWGVLGLGTPGHEERRGSARIFHLLPGAPAADGVERTHRILNQLKALFQAPSFQERWRRVEAIQKEGGLGW